jgi:23S rRNA (adenine2503-C2)-methyltransferase
MKVVASAGKEEIAVVYIGELENGKFVECVESLQPPHSREEKWVLLVSTMFGCPVGCLMCDAGGYYEGKPTAPEIFEQIDFLVSKRYPDGNVPSRQFKIQFARMGEPALNPHLLPVLDELPARYHAPGLMPSLSTVAPHGTEEFFERLLEIKYEKYPGGHFQFQFSLHTTDDSLRDQIIPVKKWGFEQMAEYGERFYKQGDRKITLNFALARGMPVDERVLLKHFSPEKFLIKVTPLNPTYRAIENQLSSYINTQHVGESYEIIQNLQDAGYQVIVSIGEQEENRIGSNCGQYIRRHLLSSKKIEDGYTYAIQPHS